MIDLHLGEENQGNRWNSEAQTFVAAVGSGFDLVFVFSQDFVFQTGVL